MSGQNGTINRSDRRSSIYLRRRKARSAAWSCCVSGALLLNPLLFEVTVFGGSLVAGVIGAIAGLGGGVLIVPLLTVGLGVDIRYAIGASIISVIATSSGAAAAYVKDRLTNLRIAMLLEIATTTGAITGAIVTGLVNARVLFVVFGVVLLISVLPLIRRLGEELPLGIKNDVWADRLRLASSYMNARTGKIV